MIQDANRPLWREMAVPYGPSGETKTREGGNQTADKNLINRRLSRVRAIHSNNSRARPPIFSSKAGNPRRFPDCAPHGLRVQSGSNGVCGFQERDFNSIQCVALTARVASAASLGTFIANERQRANAFGWRSRGFGLSDVTTLTPADGIGKPFAGRPRPGNRLTSARGGAGTIYAALDLGTNNCRLLVARPTSDGFRVIDAFSRIVRLGEGLSLTGRLSEAAITRTLDALRICRDKMAAHGVTRARAIATEACRAATNGAEFVGHVRNRLGIDLEIVDRETEAHLAAAGVGDLADREANAIVMFDIGGGSSEIIWLALDGRSRRGGKVQAWESLRLGVVSLAERFGGVHVNDEIFGAMRDFVADALQPFAAKVAGQFRCERFHLLGTSGTVTTIAGVHLNLPRYDRKAVDGLWLAREEVDKAVARVRAMSYTERAANACIGRERADLVLAGCAILEAIRRYFPAERLRIADRGLREGILSQLMCEDAVGPHRRPRWL